MNSSSLKPQTIITVVALSLVGVITYFLAIPQAQALKVSRGVLSAKLAEKKALTDKIAALNDLAEKLPQYNAEITKLAVAFPEKDQSVEALIQAQAVAEKAGLTVLSLVPSATVDGSLPIAMTLQGGYDRVGILFKELNDNLRPIKVNTVSLLSGGEQDGGVMNISLGVGFLFNRPTAAPVVPDSTAAAAPEPLPTAQ